MYEDAQKIFEYLPIRQNTAENDYIDHLWQAFSALGQTDTTSRPFAMMPFHLLFMLALQYKVLRIYKEQKEKYDLALTTKNPRDGERDIMAPESPLAIAFLGESEIVDFLKIAGLSVENTRNIKKSIIRYRNDKIAHAKGYIEPDIDTKLSEYFDWLEKLQGAFKPMNQKVASRWIKEIMEGDDMEQFLEMHLLDSCLSSRDLGDIVGKLLESEKLNLEQWKQVVDKGLDLAPDQTIIALKYVIALNHIITSKKSEAVRVLKENYE